MREKSVIQKAITTLHLGDFGNGTAMRLIPNPPGSPFFKSAAWASVAAALRNTGMRHDMSFCWGCEECEDRKVGA